MAKQSGRIPSSDWNSDRIMGEVLLAFRDSNGRIGIVEPHCPHRGAKLYYGSGSGP